MPLLRCDRCNEQFESAALQDGLCHLCLALPPQPPEPPVFGPSPRKARPCRNCSGHEFWRRLATNLMGDEVEQFVCKNCGFEERFVRNPGELTESKSCQTVTVDENGGWWDHVAPPKGDRWGPGTRIPAIVISPFARKGSVDHTIYDTASILRLITRVHGLEKLDGIVERDNAMTARGQAPMGDLTNALHFPN